MSASYPFRLPLTIQHIRQIEDYLQIETDLACISIYNPVRRMPQSCISRQITDISIDDDRSLLFHLENGAEIAVSLLPEEFTGPEACSIAYADGTYVII